MQKQKSRRAEGPRTQMGRRLWTAVLLLLLWRGDGFRGPPRTSLRSLARRGVGRAGFALTEALASLMSVLKGPPSRTEATTDVETVTSRISTSEMQRLIEKEYEDVFWVRGSMNLELWEDDCLFADPFSSFGGPGSSRRFKKNADALAGLVDQATIKAKVTSVETSKTESGLDTVKVGWSFSAKLKLPWKPVLAAAGVTSHELSPVTGKIISYREAWKSKPGEVVKRLFVPS